MSVISHLQQHLVKHLLDDLEAHCSQHIKVVLTLNLPETLSFKVQDYTFPIQLIINEHPKGFGSNHNQAFTHCDTDYYCVINPDIRIHSDPFSILISDLDKFSAALIAPLVLSTDNVPEDSVRRFPTLLSLLKKVLLKQRTTDYPTNQVIVNPDWVAGMFMLFSAKKYKLIGGFDERYFLYYEDVDICKSLHKVKEIIVFSPHTSVIHAARRSSHKKLAYLLMHIKSMLRFLLK